MAGPYAAGDGVVRGQARYAALIDQPSRGYINLYEWNLFLTPFAGADTGVSRRLGAPPESPPTHDGFYQVSDEAGLYSIYVNQPEFYARPALIHGVTILNGRTTTQNIAPAMDFCCNVTDTWTPTWEDTWYQTFVARGTSTSGVSFRLAGTSADRIEVSLRAETPGQPVTQWQQVSAGASRSTAVGSLGDNWVKWRSGIVPTVPGKRYAVRLRGVSGGDRKFAPFNRSKDGSSYADGRAYLGSGSACNYDLNVTVFSDSDGVGVTYCKTTIGLGHLGGGWADRWGQTFRAQGSSLAAADAWTAGSDDHWQQTFTFTVKENAPTGTRVGPVKTAVGAWRFRNIGLHAVSYNPGEVPLTPGRTYYIEFTTPGGFNPYVMNESQDAYPYGAAFKSGAIADGGSVDLAMTILEYAPGGGTIRGEVQSTTGMGIPGAHVLLSAGSYATVTATDGTFTIPGVEPGTYTVRAEAGGYNPEEVSGITVAEGETEEVTLVLEAPACSQEFRNGSFEQGALYWRAYGEGKENVEEGGWFGGIDPVDGTKFWGNAINGGLLPDGGLYQRFCVTPGHRYRAEAWSNVYWIGGSADAAMNRLGLDPTGGTSAGSGGVQWSPWHRQSASATERWVQLRVEAVAAGPYMTVFTDFKQNAISGHQWHINCFDAVTIEDISPTEPEFRRGDCNGDGAHDISDGICVLEYLFGPKPVSCIDALDSDDDNRITLGDGIYIFQYLFASGAPPLPPFPACGTDPSSDSLGCEAYDCGR